MAIRTLVIDTAFVIEHIKGDVGLRKYATTHDKAVEKAKQHFYNNIRIDYSGHTMAIYPVTVVTLLDEGETLEQRLENV